MNKHSENTRGPRGRPLKVTDQALLEAAHRTLGRLGPQGLTLAEVASDAGVSPGTLVHRFGSREGLLVRLSQAITDAVERHCAGARLDGRAPDGLASFLVSLGPGASTATGLANHLAFVPVELADPALRDGPRRRHAAVHAALRRLLAEARARGELVADDEARLADLLQAVVTGAQICWMLDDSADPSERVRASVTALLAPYRPASPPGSRGDPRSPPPLTPGTGQPRGR